MDVVSPTKQVIVVRKDLNMRKGKIAAQVAHASMAVLLKQMEIEITDLYEKRTLILPNNSDLSNWLNDSFTKVVVSVNSEEELLALVEKANCLEVPCALITDNGATEFNGVKTNTCAAFGPTCTERVDYITKHLPLL